MSSSEYADLLRSVVPVSFIVGQFQELRTRAYGRQFVGSSPFTKEKTPSFFVDDEIGRYHDFSSGKSGTLFTYLLDARGMHGKDAVMLIESLTGFTFVPLKYQRRRLKRRRTRRRGI